MTTQSVLSIVAKRIQWLTTRIGFPVFNSTGEILAPVVYHCTPGTTDASGNVTLTIPSGKFTTIDGYAPSTFLSGASVTTAAFVCVTAKSLTSFTLMALQSKTTGVLIGGSVQGLQVASGVTVGLTVWGH